MSVAWRASRAKSLVDHEARSRNKVCFLSAHALRFGDDGKLLDLLLCGMRHVSELPKVVRGQLAKWRRGIAQGGPAAPQQQLESGSLLQVGPRSSDREGLESQRLSRWVSRGR